MKKGLLLAAALLGVVALVYKSRADRRVTQPEYAAKTLETSRFKAAYPADWDEPGTATAGEVVFINHWRYDKTYSREDANRIRMTLTDRGTAYATVEQFVDALQKADEKPRPTQTWRLKNGLSATVRLWDDTYTESAMRTLWRDIVFQTPDGRLYEAVYHCPYDRLTGKRYEYFFRNILGSLEFKSQPARP